MEPTYKKLWSICPQREPEEAALETIALLVHRRCLARERRQMTIHGLLFLAAVIALIPTVQYLSTAVSDSGFGQYFSLMFSDTSVMLSNWQLFASSMLDALPVTGAIIVLGVLAILANSTRRLVQAYPSLLIRSNSTIINS